MIKRKFALGRVALTFLLMVVCLFSFASICLAADGSIDGVSIDFYDDNAGALGSAITTTDLTAGKLFWAVVSVNNPVKLRMIDVNLEFDKSVVAVQKSGMFTQIYMGPYFQYAIVDAPTPFGAYVTFTQSATNANTNGCVQFNPGIQGDPLPDIPAEYLTNGKLEILRVQFKVVSSIPQDGYIKWVKASAADLAGLGLIGTGESGNQIAFPANAPNITIKKPVPVAGITVSGTAGASSITTNGGTLQMLAVIDPPNADNPAVTWTVTEPDGTATTKATISPTGLLTAAGNASANGDVLVKATSNENASISGTKTITISNQIDLATSIAVTGQNGASAITTNGGTLQMTAAVSPATANQTVTWAVYAADGLASTTYATISNNGLVTASGIANNNGNVVVKATATDGSGISGTKSIAISNQTGPALVELKIVGTIPTAFMVSQSLDLSTVAKVYGKYSDNTEVLMTTGFNWVSSAPGVVYVSGSTITALSGGTADIYVTPTSGSVPCNRTTLNVAYPLTVTFAAQDQAGNAVQTFSAGTTYNFVANVSGTLPAQGNILLIVQLKDSNGVVCNLGSTETEATTYNGKIGVGFKVPTTAGNYTAEAFIWSKWPGQAGNQYMWALKKTIAVNY